MCTVIYRTTTIKNKQKEKKNSSKKQTEKQAIACEDLKCNIDNMYYPEIILQKKLFSLLS